MVFFRRRLPHYIGLRLGLQDPRGPSTTVVHIESVTGKGIERIFSRGGPERDFPKIFSRGAKSGEICF